MATRQRGCAAKKASTGSRRSLLRNRIAPEALAACAWNTFLARSNPIVLTSVTDASLKVAVNTTTLAPRCRRGASTPSLKHELLKRPARRDRRKRPAGLTAEEELGARTAAGNSLRRSRVAHHREG